MIDINQRMKTFATILLGKDLRSVGRVKEVIDLVRDQESFDQLFGLLLHHEHLLVMRAADAIEKITIARPELLAPHKGQLLSLIKSAVHKELKWHLALLISRVQLSNEEFDEVWDVFAYWVKNPNESKIVRVNSLQGLFELTKINGHYRDKFRQIIEDLQHVPIPSLQARIRKLQK